MDPTAARLRMVGQQIAARGITSPRVLAAMREVPRHLFVPPGRREEAYQDRPLPIAEGQTISQPYMVAAMTVALDPHHGDRVLEIGTGSGYQTAVLAQMGAAVFSIERHATLASVAAATLESLGFSTVRLRTSDGTGGWPDEAPFDRILVTAGSPRVPDPLRDQLAQGGRLVIPVGPSGHQRLTIVTRLGDGFETSEGESCIFVPLVGRYGWAEDIPPDR